jgi:hypothetical protein
MFALGSPDETSDEGTYSGANECADQKTNIDPKQCTHTQAFSGPICNSVIFVEASAHIESSQEAPTQHCFTEISVRSCLKHVWCADKFANKNIFQGTDL